MQAAFCTTSQGVSGDIFNDAQADGRARSERRREEMNERLGEMSGEKLLLMVVTRGGGCRARIDAELDRRATAGPPRGRIRHGRAHRAGRPAWQLVA